MNDINRDQPASLRTVLANQEVAATINSAQRLIDQQRKRILDTQLDYATRRASLANQLADLEAEMQRIMPELQGQLDRLIAMRDGSIATFGSMFG